jgi:hypothetical protein
MKKPNSMFRNGAFASAIAGFAILAVPASAALWAALPQPGTDSLDLTVYDTMPRIGAEQVPTDPYCDVQETLVINLTEEYGEELSLSALNPDQTRFDFWTSDDAGTWTVTYTRTDGVACVIGSGVGWAQGAAPGVFLSEVGVDL